MSKRNNTIPIKSSSRAVWLFPLAGGLGWALAAVGFVYNFSSVAGKSAAGIGAFAAVLTAFLIHLQNWPAKRTFSAVFRGVLLLAVPAAILSWLLPWMIQHWLPGSPDVVLKAAEVADLSCKTFAVVLGLRLVCCMFSWGAAVEALAAAIALSCAAAPDRGSITRPFWLVDAFVEQGLQAPDAFWVMGILAATVLTLVLFSHIRARHSKIQMLLVFLVVAVFFGLAVWLTHFFPPAPLAVLPPPPPPEQQMPETPPPPQPVALVELLDYYQPTERLGGFYFRAQYYSHADGFELTEAESAAPETEEAIRLAGPEWTYSGSEFGESLTQKFATVRVRIHHLDQPERPLRLVSTIGYTPLPTTDERFTVTYEIVALPPGKITDDLNLGSLRQEFGNASWTPEMQALYASVPDDPRLQRLRDEILAPLQEMYAELPGPRLAVLRKWMNEKRGLRLSEHSFENLREEGVPDNVLKGLDLLKNQAFSGEEEFLNLVKRQIGDEQHVKYQKLILKYAKDHLTFSARSESNEEERMSVEDFLFKEKTGGSQLFSQAAVLLFRSVGIPARMAGGYYYPASQDEVKAELLLTDAHATCWPEVYLHESGWVPVSLNPEDVQDRPDPAPEHDLEQLLSQVARSQESKQTAALPLISVFAPLLKAMIGFGLALLLLLLLWLNVWRRYVSMRICRAHQRPRLLFRAAVDLAAIAGFRRQYGQTWEEFARELSQRNAAIGQYFRAIAENYHTAADRNAGPHRRQPVYKELQQLGQEVTRLWHLNFWNDLKRVFTRGQGKPNLAAFITTLNPLCWWGANEPKA